MFDLPSVLPRAIAWANAQSKDILQRGQPLTAAGLKLARAVGVLRPEQIRVLTVAAIPAPEDSELRRIAREENLIGPGTGGLTLGYGVFVVNGQGTARLLSHEFRHVHQYEQAGSIELFLPIYLKQVVEFGYDQAPYEIDARAWERQ